MTATTTLLIGPIRSFLRVVMVRWLPRAMNTSCCNAFRLNKASLNLPELLWRLADSFLLQWLLKMMMSLFVGFGWDLITINNKHFRCLLFSSSETSRLVYVEVSMLPTIDSNSTRVCLWFAAEWINPSNHLRVSSSVPVPLLRNDILDNAIRFSSAPNDCILLSA